MSCFIISIFNIFLFSLFVAWKLTILDLPFLLHQWIVLKVCVTGEEILVNCVLTPVLCFLTASLVTVHGAVIGARRQGYTEAKLKSVRDKQITQ